MFKTDYAWKIYVPKEVDDEIGKYIAGMCLSYFDGYSKYSVDGGWEGHGKVYKEPTEVYEVVTGCDTWIQGAIEHIVDVIIKESEEQVVLYTQSPINIFTKERQKDV